MSDLETILIEASLLPTISGDEPEAEGLSSNPDVSNLNVISRIKMSIHESLIQESGWSRSYLSWDSVFVPHSWSVLQDKRLLSDFQAPVSN